MGNNLWLVDKHGKSFPIQHPRTRIGRDNQNQIVLADAQVSRHHATIVVEGGRVYIQDERSKNGTWVNGVRISNAHALKIGDRVRLGGVELSVSATPGRGPVIAPRQSSTVLAIAIGAPLVMVFLCLFMFAALQSQPRDSASRMISAAQGGSVWLMDGTRVDIPPGALAADTQITISIPKNPPDFGGLQPVSSTVFREFGPNGLKFLKPVKITLPYGSMDMSDALGPDAVFVARWDGKNLAYMGGIVNLTEKSVSVESSSFSFFVALPIPSPVKLKEMWNRVKNEWSAGTATPKKQNDDLTALAIKIKPAPYVWRVLDCPGCQNFYASGYIQQDDGKKVYVIEADSAWIRTQVPTSMLPSSKQNLLTGAFLGHEQSHHINKDTDFVTLVNEALAEGMRRGHQSMTLGMIKLYLMILQSKMDPLGFFSSLMEVLNAIAIPDDPWCPVNHEHELRADKEGISWARDSSPNWVTKVGNESDEDIKIQVVLSFIHYMKKKTLSWWVACTHPSGDKRAQQIRDLFLKDRNVGGIYGVVKVRETSSSGVKILSPISGRWVITDEEGRYLLAPILVGPQSLQLSKDGCRMQRFDVDVPDRDLKNQDLDFTCVPPSAEITFSANPDRINRGEYPEYSMLRWDVKYATKVYIEDKEYDLQGTLKVNPDQTKTYTLRAIGLDGKSKEAQVTVTVIQPPLTIMFSSDTQQIESGKCATLQWEVKNARLISLNSNLVSPQGSQQVCPTQTTAYTLRAEGLDGTTDSRTITISVIQPPPPQPIIIQPPPNPWIDPNIFYIHFWADRTSISAGECTVLRWDVEGVREVYLDGEGVVGHGARHVCPRQTTTYRLDVVLRDGRTTRRTVTISVSSYRGCWN